MVIAQRSQAYLLTYALLLLSLTALSAPGYAAVSAQLSAQSIDELETVRLNIKVTETRQATTLDLASLEKDFHVMNVNTMSQSRYVNGRGQSWVEYQITLQPKRTGSLLIPAIQVGNEASPSLQLLVNPLSDQARQAIDQLVFFENEVSSERVYVQAEIVLTRQLLYSQGVQLYSDLPGAPEIDNAVVLTLGETTSGTTERNGRTYGVIQQRYALFPEESGQFEIPGISITASVRLTENGRVSRKGVRIGTDTVTVTVMPVPAQYPKDKPWLPAREVRLLQVVTPENKVHNVGDTLQHELLIDISGNVGSKAPPLELLVDDRQFRVYPAAPTINDDTQGSSVQGARLQTNSLVPLQQGNLAMPEAALTWWDTETDQMRITTAPGEILSVVGEALIPAPPEEDQQMLGKPAQPDTPTQTDRDVIDAANTLSWSEIRPLIATAALIGIGVLLLIGGYRAMRRSGPLKGGRSAKSQLFKAFKQADPQQVHALLPVYLASHYGCARSEATQRFTASSSEARNAYQELLKTLYGTNAASSMQVNFQQLRRALEALDREPQVISLEQRALPDLYTQPGL